MQVTEMEIKSKSPLTLSEKRRWRDIEEPEPARKHLEAKLGKKSYNPKMASKRLIKLDPQEIGGTEHFKQLFREKFGRDPGPDDPLLFDPDADTPQEMSKDKLGQVLAEIAAAAGLAPHFIYAMRRTGLIVTKRNERTIPKEKLDEWNRAIDEYLQLERKIPI